MCRRMNIADDIKYTKMKQVKFGSLKKSNRIQVFHGLSSRNLLWPIRNKLSFLCWYFNVQWELRSWTDVFLTFWIKMFYWLHKIIRSWLYLLWALQLGNQTLIEILFFCLLVCFSLLFVLHSTNGFYPKGGFGDLQFDDCRIITVNNKISWENVSKHVQLTNCHKILHQLSNFIEIWNRRPFWCWGRACPHSIRFNS